MAATLGWLTAGEALAALRVRSQTLYAYVSRGRIQSRPDPNAPQRSLYSAPDVERLALASRTVRRPSAVAASTIAWGEPMLTSAISTVHEGRLIYRGTDAVALSATATLEEIAVLLWAASPRDLAAAKRDTEVPARSVTPVFEYLASKAWAGGETRGRSTSELHAVAFELFRGIMLSVAGGDRIDGEPTHIHLARCWNAPEAAEPLRCALVLLADHELNVSTFAARVTASSGASLAACLLSGLCALSGALHGRSGMAVSRMVRELQCTGSAAGLAGDVDELPGFGHPLYAGVDPRAAALLQTFDVPPAHARLRDEVRSKRDRAPNIDFALSALAAGFGLPPEAPFLIFAAARSVGWSAHALEQAADGRLIRPRAKYVGPLCM